MEEGCIYFHTEDCKFSLKNETKVYEWVNSAIVKENKLLGKINCIFCSDNYLLNINQNYLSHNTYTDIITFNYVQGNLISGDLYISIERVKDNATKFNVESNEELNRVIIHGILHLIGYNDKTPEEAHQIREKEDFYLTLLNKK